MQARDGLLYLAGSASAIRAVAQSQVAFVTGVALVLLTAIARIYDQAHISEAPLLFLFGPLLFSVVSGTWLYLIAYGWLARRFMAGPEEPKPAFGSGWLSFMGLFWMTAPIAWLYAIPVERFLDSVSAAKANVALLATVSLWRVMLMARVFQVLCGPPLLLALCWVLVPASVEMLFVFLIGGGFGEGLLAGMSGLRQSPEKEVLLGAVGFAFGSALFSFPIALIVAGFWRMKKPTTPLPELKPTPAPWGPLAGAAVFWITVAVVPQRELANTVAVERLVEEGRLREALDYLSVRQPGDFAPARPLPPKAFERRVFEQLPALLGVAKETDAAWVRQHLIHRLDEMQSHLNPRRRQGSAFAAPTHEERVAEVRGGLIWGWGTPNAAEHLLLLDGLQRLPEGRAWLATNAVFLEALGIATAEMITRNLSKKESDQGLLNVWRALGNRLHELGVTNVMTNAPLSETNPSPAKSPVPP